MPDIKLKFYEIFLRPVWLLAGLLAVLAGLGPLGASEARAARIVENLYGCKLVSPTTGWVVGAFGAIFKTTDGGKSWAAQKAPVVEYLFSVDFGSPESGVAVGRAGTVLTTSDGGNTWVKRDSGTERNLFSVTFASPKSVWAIGDWGQVIHSADGGVTWSNRSLTNDVVLTSQAWLDEQHGYLAGEFGTIQITSDGGQTWTAADTGTEKTLFGVAFSSVQKGWAVGIDGLVLRTTDAGKTWEVQRGTREVQSLEQLGFMEAMRNPGLYDVRVSSGSGYIVGDTGMILVSSDGGETWTERKLPAEMSLYWLRGVAMFGTEQALIVGANGLTATAKRDQILHQKES